MPSMALLLFSYFPSGALCLLFFWDEGKENTVKNGAQPVPYGSCFQLSYWDFSLESLKQGPEVKRTIESYWH